MGTLHKIHKNQFTNPADECELFNHTLKQTILYGFDHFFFSITPNFGNIYTDSKITTSYPIEFVKCYSSNVLLHKNAIIAHCQTSIDPIIWDEAAFIDTPHFSKGAHAYGVNYGWSQAVHDAKGAVSILTLIRRSTPVSPEEFNEKAGDILWLCNQLHSAMAVKLFNQPTMTEPIARLSVRESEVLKWTAQGKTASDIAMILSLIPRTVNFHISSVIRKMGASNKTSAVVIASKSGLL